MKRPKLQDAMRKADVVFEREHLMREIVRVGEEITRDYTGNPPLFLTVMQGGLVFAGHLALAVKRDMEFDYVHATRYRSGTSGSELRWVKSPGVPLGGRDVLLVDDIVDEGKTLAAVRDWCRSQNAASVRIAALAVKLHDRCMAGLKADYFGVEVPDRYVFGFGMDYYEQGRNLPAIYAI